MVPLELVMKVNSITDFGGFRPWYIIRSYLER
jgi:hypothetical protein